MKRVQQETGQRILFTGPDGIGDYRPRLDYFPRSIGIGALSPDATRDLEYLFRPAPQATPPLPKHCYTGEVGWGLQYSSQLNRTVIHSKQNEFDKYHSGGVTHSQWHTSPQFWDKQLPCTNHSTHDRHSEDNNAVTAKLGDILYKQERQSLYTEKAQTDSIPFPQI